MGYFDIMTLFDRGGQRALCLAVGSETGHKLHIVFSLIKRQVGFGAAFPCLWAHRTGEPLSPP